MARYHPSQGKDNPTQVVHVASSEEEDESYTVYVVQVTIEKYTWTVRHRYSHFAELHDQLTQHWNLEKSLLPPKKVFGKRNDDFVQKRKNALNIYLQTVLKSLPQVPPPLAAFLQFHTYEIHGILKSLAKDLYLRGDCILTSKDNFILSPVHLYALSERLKLPEPPCESADKSQDLSHIVDFLSKVERVTILGSPVPIGTSNIVPDQLAYDFLRFKNLKHLKLQRCCPFMISGLEVVRKTLEVLEIHSSLSSIKDFVLSDVVHSDANDSNPSLHWPKLTKVGLSYNNLTGIDHSIRLLPRVEELNLSHNHISEIHHLESLPSLRCADLSFNRFRHLDALHTKLGNVVALNLADNAIEHLRGFSKLYSLVTLDLTSNKIAHISEVTHLAKLPCLENLTLLANPVTLAIDYRTRIFELFDARASELCLDNEGATSKELDTVAVRLALRRARQGGGGGNRENHTNTISAQQQDSAVGLKPEQNGSSTTTTTEENHAHQTHNSTDSQ